VESAAIGLLAGRFAAAERIGRTPVPPPATTALGALLGHITGGHLEAADAGPRSFQPMNVNYGLFPPAEVPDRDEAGKRLKGRDKGLAKKAAISRRALADLAAWLAQSVAAAA
jgi:methylenetetrahydrofolate--tRNA-(uracil-5-)-methyltransferase